MSFFDTPTKDIPRRYVMRKRPISTARVKAAKTAFLLTGPEMLCFKEGFRSGLLNPHTLVGICERDVAAQRKIAASLNRIPFEWVPRLWRDEIHNMPLRAMFDNRPLEFSYLDLCSPLNPRIGRWIYTEFAPALAEGATVGITLQRSWRRSSYMKWWHNAVAKRGSDAYKVYVQADAMIRNAECTGVVGDLSTFYDDSLSSAMDSFTLPRPTPSRWNQLLRPEYHNASVESLAAFMVLMPYHRFRLDACIEYQRDPSVKTWMTTYVLTEITRTDESFISSALLKQLGENVSPTLRPAAL